MSSPEGNGEAERAVQVVKNFLHKAGDPYMAMLVYRPVGVSLNTTGSRIQPSRAVDGSEA